MIKSPKITVLLPVYNSEGYIKQAIESILHQTLANFEFLIIDDGSTDNSMAVIKSIQDKRIKILQNEKNIGLIQTLNIGLRSASGQYIARMDQDDISMPDRLLKQSKFLDSHPDVAVCGCWVKNFGSNQGFGKLPSDAEEIAIMLLFENAIAHPASMIRKSAIHGISYRDEYIHAEDYDLWARLSLSWRLYNIPEILLKYRVHKQQISQVNSFAQKDTAIKIKATLLENLGAHPTSDDLATHILVTSYGTRLQKKSLDDVEKWLMKLILVNKESGKFDQQKFSQIVERYWKIFCMQDGSLGLYVFTRCVGSPLYQINKKLDLSMLSLLARSSAYSVWHHLKQTPKIKLFQ